MVRASLIHAASHDFRDWIFTNSFIDMGFEGIHYIWSRNGGAMDCKMARLDCCLCSKDWRLLFSEASILHPTKLHSNHQVAWFNHSDFLPKIRDSWCTNVPILETLSNLKFELSAWNKKCLRKYF